MRYRILVQVGPDPFSGNVDSKWTDMPAFSPSFAGMFSKALTLAVSLAGRTEPSKLYQMADGTTHLVEWEIVIDEPIKE